MRPIRRRPASPDHARTAVAGLLDGNQGVQLLAARPDARAAVLRDILESLRGRAMVVWIDSEAPVRDLEATLADAAFRRSEMGGRPRPVILVDNADRLSPAGLTLLNGVAEGRVLGLANTAILLAGTNDLPSRLAAHGNPALRSHLATTIDLGHAAPLAGPAPARADRPRTMALLGVTLAATLAPAQLGRQAPQTVPGPALETVVRPSLPPLDDEPAQAVMEAALVPPPDPRPPETPPAPTPPAPNPPANPPAADLPASNPPRPFDGTPPVLPGLLLVARPGDTLEHLYQLVYKGVRPPPYGAVAQANPLPVRPGAVLTFPTPPEGWARP